MKSENKKKIAIDATNHLSKLETALHKVLAKHRITEVRIRKLTMDFVESQAKDGKKSDKLAATRPRCRVINGKLVCDF